MGNDIRNRFKQSGAGKSGYSKPLKNSRKHNPRSSSTKSNSTSSDIFSIWEDQRRMGLEEKKMAQELAETKKKAKALKKTLRKHQFGETKILLKGKPKKIAKKSRNYFSKSKLSIGNHKKQVAFVVVLLVVLLAVAFGFSVIGNNNATETLGESTSSQDNSGGIFTSDPSFKVLAPVGKPLEQLRAVERKSPDGDTIYTFSDTLENNTIEVTQQTLPEDLKKDQENKLFEIAQSFNMTNVIQVNESKIYHGLNDELKSQSLVLIKNGNLVFITSPQKISDDQWANYFLSLQ